MKHISLSLLLAFAIPFQARAVGRESGGGAQIEGAFRMRAYELINSISDSPRADAICPADLMRTSLRATKVRVVDELMDPSTGKSLTSKNLDAWTVPGDMQLLKDSWSRFLDPASSQVGKSVDVLILHETYRSTAGRCDDEGFKISDHILSLFALPTKYSQVFALTGNQNPDFSNHNTYRNHYTYCNSAPVQGAQIICAVLYPSSAYQLQNEFHLVQGDVSGFGSGGSPLVREHLSIAMRPLTPAEFQQLLNLLAFVSPTNPFYTVFDMQSGNWSYGFDLANLIKLP